MSVDEVREPLERWSSEDVAAGTATLVRVKRSAPRRPGARFAVAENGELAGSVSAGCVEGDLHEHLRRTLDGEAPRLVHYGITDEMAAEVGLSCGGEIDVLVDRHRPDDPAWARLLDVLDRDAAAVLFTGLSEPIRGARFLLESDGSVTGTLGSEDLDRRAADAAGDLFDHGGTKVLTLGEEGPEAFAEGFLPPERLAIVGASPAAEALCHLAAYLGYRVTVVDPREAFAESREFPDAERVVTEWPEEGLERAGLDRWLNVVVLAHDAKLDVPALAAALEAGCLYVGQIGGGRTQRSRREALSERGFGPEELERIRGPVGLDIGAESPKEIALAILAEIVAVRRGASP